MLKTAKLTKGSKPDVTFDFTRGSCHQTTRVEMFCSHGTQRTSKHSQVFKNKHEFKFGRAAVHVGNRNTQQATCRIFFAAAAAVAAVAPLSPLCAAAAADFSSAASAGASFTCAAAASDFLTLVTFAASGAASLISSQAPDIVLQIGTSAQISFFHPLALCFSSFLQPSLNSPFLCFVSFIVFAAITNLAMTPL